MGPLNAGLIGYRALESLRLEKGYRAWGSDITPNDSPFEAGLGWAVKLATGRDFLGREAAQRAAATPLAKRLACFTVSDPNVVLLGRETILRNGEVAGYLTSGGFGYTVGKPIGYGYVRRDGGVTDEYLETGMEVAGVRAPYYDDNGELKAQLYGGHAKVLEGGVADVTNLRIDVFQDGEVVMTIFPPRCFTKIDDYKVMIIGQQKGRDTKSNVLRNFGMANPEGYRKALRLMKLAEKFNKPVITLIDTPGAYPGLEAEQNGQAEAIARNLLEMSRLKVPIIVVIIGEGASGGALGIGVGDRILMLENTWYSVISPESCSSILWRSWDYKEQAAEALKLTAEDLLELKIIDRIVPEPLGGAHKDHKLMSVTLKEVLKEELENLVKVKPEKMLQNRIDKFGKMGAYEE